MTVARLIAQLRQLVLEHPEASNASIEAQDDEGYYIATRVHIYYKNNLVALEFENGTRP